MHVMKSRRFTRLSPREAQSPLTHRQDNISEISSFLSRDGAAQGIRAIDINAGQAQKLTRQDRSDGFLPIMPTAEMRPRFHDKAMPASWYCVASTNTSESRPRCRF
jgi:hypothetical protein